MKRVNTIFTMLNIFIIASMLIYISIEYSMQHYSAPPSLEFIKAVLFIPPLLTINILWQIIRRKIGRKNNEPIQSTPNDFEHNAKVIRCVNIVFIAINLLIVVTMLLHIFVFSNFFEYTSSKFDVVIFYIIPLMLTNDTWYVIYMNKKQLKKLRGNYNLRQYRTKP